MNTSRPSTPVPMKKPQSAYFIFSGERRQEIKDELLKDKETVSMGEVAKAIGSAWKSLSDEERQRYQDLAAEQKELYKKTLEEAGGANEGNEGNGAEGALDQTRIHSMLPLSMVKKVVMKDDEVNRITGDALKVLTEATGLFLGNLASKSLALALGNNKKNFKLEDMVKVAKIDARLVDMGLVKAFEEEPFKEWLAGSGGANLQRKRTADGAANAGGRKKAVATSGGIAAFLTKKSNHAEEEAEEEVVEEEAEEEIVEEEIVAEVVEHVVIEDV